jgi:hypothetical protein
MHVEFCVYKTDGRRLRESRRRKMKGGFVIQLISLELSIQGAYKIRFSLKY